MSKRRDQDFLGDIREAIQRIAAYTEDMTYEQFMKDSKTQDAVIRNLEVIGEATKNLSDRLRKAHPQIPWRDLAGMRDKMIHHYFTHDLAKAKYICDRIAIMYLGKMVELGPLRDVYANPSHPCTMALSPCLISGPGEGASSRRARSQTPSTHPRAAASTPAAPTQRGFAARRSRNW